METGLVFVLMVGRAMNVNFAEGKSGNSDYYPIYCIRSTIRTSSQHSLVIFDLSGCFGLKNIDWPL